MSAEIILTGIGNTPGIAIGKARVIPRRQKNQGFLSLCDSEQVAREVERLRRAIDATRQDFEMAYRELEYALNEYSSILDAHSKILEDKLIKNQAEKFIVEKMVSAEWALSMTQEYVEKIFSTVKDEYIRSRFSDVSAVIDQILNHLIPNKNLLGNINEEVVLIAYDLTPADLSRLDTNLVLGLGIDQGGPTSHLAIMARALGIPTVLGLVDVTNLAENGDTIILDGSHGEIIIRPEPHSLATFQDRQAAYELYIKEIISQSDQLAVTLDGCQVEVGANIELLEEVPSVRNFGAENVGLFRTEFTCLAYNRPPTEEEMFNVFHKLVKELDGLLVNIRTLDIGGDKLAAFMPETGEVNPNLGLRAIRYCLKEQEFFLSQLRAILRASHYGPVGVMFPLVSSVEELREAKKCLHRAQQQLKDKNMPFAENISLGIMVEVPSAVMIADLLAKEVDFFSIGTNDLIQYTMAIDRKNEQVASLYQPLHPAVIRSIACIVKMAAQHKVKVSMCGEMAGVPYFIPLLLGLGIKSFSMSPVATPSVKQAICQTRVCIWEEIGKQALNLPTVAEIENLVTSSLKKHLVNFFD